jgi:hypothetical protein
MKTTKIKRVEMKTKRIQVSLEITIPADWNIGETDDWFVSQLSHHRGLGKLGWKVNVLVNEQRSAASCPDDCPCRGESHSQRVKRLERERPKVL